MHQSDSLPFEGHDDHINHSHHEQFKEAFDNDLCELDPSSQSQREGDPFHPARSLSLIEHDRFVAVPSGNKNSQCLSMMHQAGLHAIKHVLRTSKNHNMKHLILGDSLTVTLCEEHGRSSSFHMRRVPIQVAALAFGSGTTFRFRWLPSE